MTLPILSHDEFIDKCTEVLTELSNISEFLIQESYNQGATNKQEKFLQKILYETGVVIKQHALGLAVEFSKASGNVPLRDFMEMLE